MNFDFDWGPKVNSDKPITIDEGYAVMLYVARYYYELTTWDDLTDILSGGEYMTKDSPGDIAFWQYWLEGLYLIRKVNIPDFTEENRITEKQGYEAMIYMLYDYWKLKGSIKITEFLRGAEMSENNNRAENIFWLDWIKAVEKVKTLGPPPLKKWIS